MSLAVGVGGRLVFSHDGRRRRVPASNQKLLLSFALLDRLGPDHRIPTSALGGKLEDGTLKGDLWLIGHGDPTLTRAAPSYWGDITSPTIAELAKRVKESGVTEIDGRVMGATDFFAHDFDVPGWQPYVPDRYVQLPSSLALDGNYMVGHRPERAVARALSKSLEDVGVRVGGLPGWGKRPGGLSRLATVRSRPLIEIVSYMNRTSNNFFAEMLGKLLGAEVFGPDGTIAKGARAIKAWTRGSGVRAAVYDSSGLSYKNRVSTQALVKLLGRVEGKTWGRALRTGLAAPGEGTLRYRLAGLSVRAKTGSLFNGASALSGWVRPAGGERWVEFSILDQDAPQAIEDRIVGVISRAHIRRPPLQRSTCSTQP
ncbi:MAG: D-alanyl-D-alanine carboxypeptidase/D-alanyl-D-alanine-endopeptidase [Actinomycetota bacterium]